MSIDRYAIQFTVAYELDGALSGPALKEVNSRGKVDTAFEQIDYREAKHIDGIK